MLGIKKGLYSGDCSMAALAAIIVTTIPAILVGTFHRMPKTPSTPKPQKSKFQKRCSISNHLIERGCEKRRGKGRKRKNKKTVSNFKTSNQPKIFITKAHMIALKTISTAALVAQAEPLLIPPADGYCSYHPKSPLTWCY